MHTRLRSIVAAFILLATGSICNAHLGEVHPDGQHDYFPDFDVSTLTDDIYIRTVLNVHGARDLAQIPDGSGRYLAMRATNFVKMSKFGWQGEFLFVRTESDDVADTEGAVSIEIHPGYATEGDPGYGKFYTVTIEKAPSAEPDFASTNSAQTVMHSVVTEWTTTDPAGTRFDGTSRELLRLSEGSPFHNINDLAFGPDGMLYMAVGEDTFGSQAADLSSPYGKILRVDPFGTDGSTGSYGIPTDNPFIDNEAVLPEVYAYGLRNPWRINFDSDTGDLYAADIGWNSIEEANLIEPALNYGWPAKEGSFLTANEATIDAPDPITGLTVAQANNYVEPLFELDQTDTNSILGGVLYRGERFPELVGKYVFGSWNNGDVFVGDPATGEIELLMEKGTVANLMNDERYVSINEDLDGEIYLVGGHQIRALFRHPDFDDSGALDGADGDLICENFGSESAVYDLNGDLRVDVADLDVLLEMANSLPGDFDLNGSVDFTDFLALSRSFGNDEVHWSSGDTNCDQQVDFEDFLTFSDHFGSVRAAIPTDSVPEGRSGWQLVIGIAMISQLRRRQRIA